MKRTSIPLRTAAMSIVYGWLFLLGFALVASVAHGGHAQAPQVGASAVAGAAGH
jgi:hypothetical protein